LIFLQCGPIIDETAGNWRRRFNKELYNILELSSVTSFIKGQRIQWVGYIMRRGEMEAVRVALEWRLQGKRPRGRP